jgi:predicted ribosomally synthesized peptide with nif11-like leader
MTEAAVQAFAERLQIDRAFRDRLTAANPEERLQIARESGFDVGPRDADAIRTLFGAEELSDEVLEDATGGFFPPPLMTQPLPGDIPGGPG